MIFKQQSCESELFEGMQEAQNKSIEKEANYETNLIIRAMEELKFAAENFERAGRTDRAKEVTTVMLSLANNKDKDEEVNNSSQEEVKNVFMFFGFSPDDFKGINFSSNGDKEDKE